MELVETSRLRIVLASDAEMTRLIAEEKDEEMKQAYREMLDGCLREPQNRRWFAAWFIELKSGERIGDLCFKGISRDGMVEIGYGLNPDNRGFGYATEAVRAMTEWAAAQPGVCVMEAETDPDNIASQRVLEKSGYHPTGEIGEEGPRFRWEKSES